MKNTTSSPWQNLLTYTFSRKHTITLPGNSQYDNALQKTVRQVKMDSYACFLMKENIAYYFHRSVYPQKSTVVSWNGFRSSDVLKTRSELRTLWPYCRVACQRISTAENASLQTMVTGTYFSHGTLQPVPVRNYTFLWLSEVLTLKKGAASNLSF